MASRRMKTDGFLGIESELAVIHWYPATVAGGPRGSDVLENSEIRRNGQLAAGKGGKMTGLKTDRKMQTGKRTEPSGSRIIPRRWA